MTTPKDIAKKLAERGADDGKLVELGWRAFEMMVMPPDASTVQRVETRRAFFAGAQHLFGSIMQVLGAGEEPTPEDLRRMTLINTELDAWILAEKTGAAQNAPSSRTQQ